MDNIENIFKKSSNSNKNIKKQYKITSRGREIVTPKKLLTTSSDDKMKKKRLIKQKSINIHEELQDLQQSRLAKPNILKNISAPSMKKSKQCNTLETPHNVNSVLPRSMSMDNSLLHKNLKQSLEQDANYTWSGSYYDDTRNNDTCNNDQNTSSSKNRSGSYYDDTRNNDTCNNDQNTSSSKNRSGSYYDDTRNNDTCNNDQNTSSSKNRSITLNIDEIPFVFNDGLQKSDCRAASEKNGSQSEIIKLLRQVVEQNSEILSDMKVLKKYHMSTTQNNLYIRPDGFPLKTIKEFLDLEADTDRLQELLTYLKFVGGLKLREALSHFHKETLTDELTCQFTYWGRRKNSVAFYNTQVAKVFFYAAKMCPNFKEPETRAEFQAEIMEVFRAAKQRYSLKHKNAAEEEEMSEEDPLIDTPEMDNEDCDDNTECYASDENECD